MFFHHQAINQHYHLSLSLSPIVHLTYVHDDLYNIAFLFSTSSDSIYNQQTVCIHISVYVFYKSFCQRFLRLVHAVCFACPDTGLNKAPIHRYMLSSLFATSVSELLAASALETFYTLLVAFSGHILNCKLKPISLHPVSVVCIYICCVIVYIIVCYNI